MRKTAKVSVGLCPGHRSARRRHAIVAWVLCVLGVAMMFGFSIPEKRAGTDAEFIATLAVLGGLATLIVGLLVSIKLVPVVAARRIDDQYVHLTGAGRPFLESLPRVQPFEPLGRRAGRVGAG